MNPLIRIQRKRTKGFNLQAQSPDGRPVVSVCRPGKWGNPFKVYKVFNEYCVANETESLIIPGFFEKSEATERAVDLFWQSDPETYMDLEPLRGKHLACFCSPESRCHADVLLKLANT